MGLFSNKKKLCPICGSPTPRLFPTVVDGTPVCKECKKKVNLPEGALDSMKLDDFRQYMAYYQENQTLRDAFEETFCWNSVISMDVPKRQFRLDGNVRGLVMEASCLKAFRILEDEKELFESGPEGLRRYESDTTARAEALEPVVEQFKLQFEQYRRMEEMKRDADGKDGAPSFPYMSRPIFDCQLIKKGFTLEVTLEHPYWNGVHRWVEPGPQFDSSYPSVSDFVRKYQREADTIHAMAVNLMAFINPGAPEIPFSRGLNAGNAAPVQAPSAADPVGEIQKYKALLDSGAITEEEFSAKKRQILGI